MYSQRQAVERAFSRLNGQRSLNHITVRRRRKVTLHCYLALIAMQESSKRLRSLGLCIVRGRPWNVLSRASMLAFPQPHHCAETRKVTLHCYLAL